MLAVISMRKESSSPLFHSLKTCGGERGGREGGGGEGRKEGGREGRGGDKREEDEEENGERMGRGKVRRCRRRREEEVEETKGNMEGKTGHQQTY